MSHRKERFSSTLRQNLAEILQMEMNNPLFKSIYISRVQVSPDLKKAWINIQSLQIQEKNNPEELISQLIKAKGFIKKQLGKRMYLKYIPDIEFLKEDSASVIYANEEIQPEDKKND